MPDDPTFAEQMVAKLEALLLKNAGLKAVNVDGTMVSYDDLEAKWEFWKTKVAREGGGKRRAATISLRNT